MSRTTWDDLVFTNRNKDYGAYYLRRSYGGVMVRAFIAALFTLALVMAFPHVRELLREEAPATPPANKLKYSELIAPPPIDRKVVPPPRIDEMRPRETVKFLPPKLTQKEVTDDPVPLQEELKQVEPAEQTQAGESVIIDEPVEAVVTEEAPDPSTVYLVVQQQPEFPGGIQAMMKFIGQHMKYPASARRMGTQGSVFVSFVVEADGRISEVQTVKGISTDCDKEAMRVIQSMPPWKPGKQNGRAVRVRFVLPLKFVLNT